jgi:predicted dehydrogenase
VTQLKWGVLGAGGIAKTFVADCKAAGINMAAVASRSLDKAKQFAADAGIDVAYGSYEQLVADPEIDIVYVATLHPTHAEHAILAINAGKHVLVEKPFTLNAREAQAVAQAAAENSVFVMEAMWTRFLPSMLRIEQIIADGGIGELRALQADHSQYLPYTRAPRLHERELGGGALLDLGVYPVSFANRLFGKPESISARAKLTDQGVDEISSAIFTYATGAEAIVQSNFMALGSNKATVIGSEGRIEIDSVWYEHTSFSHFNSQGDLVERYETKIAGRGMHFQALEVEQCVAANKLQSDRMSLDESIQIMQVMDEIRAQVGVQYPGE